MRAHRAVRGDPGDHQLLRNSHSFLDRLPPPTRPQATAGRRRALPPAIRHLSFERRRPLMLRTRRETATLLSTHQAVTAAPGLVCSAPPSPAIVVECRTRGLATVYRRNARALRQRRCAGISHLGWVPGIKGAGYWTLGRYTRTTWHYNLQGHVQNIASAGCGPASTSTPKQQQQKQRQFSRSSTGTYGSRRRDAWRA